MTCPTCRPSTFHGPDALECRWSHEEAGIRRSFCPGCGRPRWPWEYPEPEWPASGLRWVMVMKYQRVSWELLRGGKYEGVIHPGESCPHYAVRYYRHVHTGTLHDCARALVAEVRR